MASPFSFHCMICFEEFHIETRYPVVLPCGHTYVCNQCAERLDKCMECRTSLFHIIHKESSSSGSQAVTPGAAAGRWGARTNTGAGRHATNNRAISQPPIKKRLPLPKNVVLMSLIEATELAAENVRGQDQEPSLEASPQMDIATSVLDVEEDEEEKIKTGTSLAISDCGTYAVAAKDGLEIFPSRPESAFQLGQEQAEEDVDTLVRFFHLDHKLELDDELKENTSEERASKALPPAKLSLGDRVQIVSTEAGWAKLARGYGYVRAGRNEVVKVGGSVDRACKLEALLRLLSTRRKELRTEQQRVDNQFIALMNELQASLMTDEDLTVIPADTFHQKTNTLKEDFKFENRDNESSGHLLCRDERSHSNEDSTPLKPRPMERPMTPPGETSRGFFCASTDVFNSVIPLSARTSDREPPVLPSVSQAPSIAEVYSNHSSNSVESTPTRLFPSGTQPSPSALRAGARAWREMHGRPASVNTGIDFRTGMSGHTALSSSSAHPHDFLLDSHSVFRGMSNHSGLTMWKSSGRRQPRTNHLGMPMFPAGSTSPDAVSMIQPSPSPPQAETT